MKEYFECKVRIARARENGEIKHAVDMYLVEAVNYTEAEAIIYDFASFVNGNGEFSIKSINKTKYVGVVNVDNVNDDEYWKLKVAYEYSEGVEKPKTVNEYYLVGAVDAQGAIEAMGAETSTWQLSCEVKGVGSTAICSVIGKD